MSPQERVAENRRFGARGRLSPSKEAEKTELKPVSEYVYGNSLIARNDYKESYSRYGYASGYVTGNREYYGQDILGSTMLVTNGVAGVVQKYAYDAYGNNYEGSFAGSNNIGYNGKRYDGGTGWYDYGFRDYDSRTGRFTTVDPIRDGMNWYAYCGGDPINCVDLWGLSQESDNGSNIEQLFAKYTLEQINAIENYKTQSNYLNELTKESLDMSCKINQLEYKVDVLKGENKKISLEYIKQECENVLSVLQVFGPAINEAVKQPDLYSAVGVFILNIDPQSTAEYFVDSNNSNSLTKNEVKKTKSENNKEIKEVKSEIRGLKAELKENKRLQDECKENMEKAREKFYGNN